ncbi:MAG: threonine/serine dehydratase [Chloroflexota bacterium]
MTIVTPSDINSAYERIRNHVRKTPVIDLEEDAFGNPGRLTLKLESLQHAGSFKPRGAFNRVLCAEHISGVVAASGGNHGIATAHVAQRLGLPADIFVPSISSPVKQARIRGLGATVHVGGDLYADALAASETFLDTNGGLAVHAYNHPHVIAGQGTLGLEWESQSPNLDTILVAVGGGGLIAGICAWYAGRVKIVSVEPDTSQALHAAREKKKITKVSVSGIAADSLGASTIGEMAFEITQTYLDKSLLVSNEAIQTAQKALWSTLQIAAEPGGAAAMAAILSGAYQPQPGERVGVLVCGGNVDLTTLV